MHIYLRTDVGPAAPFDRAQHVQHPLEQRRVPGCIGGAQLPQQRVKLAELRSD